MSSSARKTMRAAYRDATGAITRSIPTLFLTCISVVILSGADDHTLISGGEVSTPFIGKARYEMFIILAPIAIIALKLYADMQLLHFRRVSRIVSRHNIQRPITLSHKNNIFLFCTGLFAVHIVPSIAMAFLGYHASAFYPVYGLGLYIAAIALLVWSTFALSDWSQPTQVKSLAGVSLAVLGIGLATLWDAEATIGCERRYDGFAAKATKPFLRKVKLERAKFVESNASGKDFTCGLMEGSNWYDADVRYSKFQSASLSGASFHKSNLYLTDFNYALLRRADFREAAAAEAAFRFADIGYVDFSNAFLAGSNFHSAYIADTVAAHSVFNFASFTKASLMDVTFSDSQLFTVHMLDAELEGVIFKNSNLSGADFSSAALTDVSFDNSRLECASFYRTKMSGVDFSEVSAADLRAIEVESHIANCLTCDIKIPEDFKMEDLGVDYGKVCKSS